MNIPKFRAWLKDVGLMKNVVSIHFEDKEVYFGEIDEIGDDPLFDLDDVILMQSTGLTDKNGVEIFEGDILQKDPKNEDWVDVKIEWHKEKATFVYVHIYNKYEFGYMDDRGYSDYIVIGNIHANKELLNDNM